MTDAIVIVLTLALAALVLWLPVWLMGRWVREEGDWAGYLRRLRALESASEDWDAYDAVTFTDGLPRTYVQPHMRAGRPVHGYYRRTKR